MVIHFIPIGSMYGIFAYIWLIFMVNVGKDTVRPMDPMGLEKATQCLKFCEKIVPFFGGPGKRARENVFPQLKGWKVK